jgi:hypothetical protein
VAPHPGPKRVCGQTRSFNHWLSVASGGRAKNKEAPKSQSCPEKVAISGVCASQPKRRSAARAPQDRAGCSDSMKGEKRKRGRCLRTTNGRLRPLKLAFSHEPCGS